MKPGDRRSSSAHPAYYAGLNGHAPASYPEAVQILKQVAPHFRGVEYVFFP